MRQWTTFGQANHVAPKITIHYRSPNHNHQSNLQESRGVAPGQ